VSRRWLAAGAVLLLAPASCGWYPQVKAPVAPSAAAGAAAGDPVLSELRQARRLDGVLDGRTGAHLLVGSAAASVDLRFTDLPGLLYRISTPAGSGLAPRVTGPAGVVGLRLAPTGDDGPDRVDIALNRQVRWHIRMTAGAGERHLDLDDGRLSGIVLAAGAGLISLRLPRPHGTVPISLSGGVGTAEVMAPIGIPVRVRLARGASHVRLPGRVRARVRAGTVFTPRSWTAASDRYVLEARDDIGSLTVSG
jgi:hypothetical protein